MRFCSCLPTCPVRVSAGGGGWVVWFTWSFKALVLISGDCPAWIMRPPKLHGRCSGLNSDPSNSFPARNLNVPLFGKYGLCGYNYLVTLSWSLNHTRFRVRSKSWDWYLPKRKENEIWTLTRSGEKILQRQRQSLEGGSHKPRSTKGCQELEEAGKDSPLELW